MYIFYEVVELIYVNCTVTIIQGLSVLPVISLFRINAGGLTLACGCDTRERAKSDNEGQDESENTNRKAGSPN